MKPKYILFSVALIIAASSVNAQTDSIRVNPLWATTGPNVMPKGGMQLNTVAGYHYFDLPFSGTPRVTTNSLEVGANLRHGIGKDAELLATAQGMYGSGSDSNFAGGMFAAGVKIKLFDGRGALPQVSFRTDLALHYERVLSGQDYTLFEPSLQLNFRNPIGERFTVDYMIGTRWHNAYSSLDEILSYSIGINWLASSRLALGLAFGRHIDNAMSSAVYHLSDVAGSPQRLLDLTVMYQANDRLQLSLQGNAQMGASRGFSYTNTNLMLGLHWRVR